jgi:hypothetical protein
MPNKDRKKNKRSTIVMFGYKNIINIKNPMGPK